MIHGLLWYLPKPTLLWEYKTLSQWRERRTVQIEWAGHYFFVPLGRWKLPKQDRSGVASYSTDLRAPDQQGHDG
jgi:hypothetical protein